MPALGLDVILNGLSPRSPSVGSHAVLRSGLWAHPAGAAWVGLPVQARLEEKLLVARFEDAYKRHHVRTGRFWLRR